MTSMLALRDQENLVHAHQTAAAAKPANQGRPLPPKTPFKVPLNDENDPLAFGKKTVRVNDGRNENTLKPAKDAFVTPLGPRNRAPLGMKTTNAKAKGLQTPAPPAGTLKPEKSNKRNSTAQKVRKAAPLVQPSKTELLDKLAEDEVPDIEYMPPKPKELPDEPDDITYDTTFPQFQGKNMALGLERVYGDNEVGPDGLTKKERQLKEESIAYDKMVDEMIQQQVDSLELLGILDRDELEIQKPRRAKEASKTKQEGSKTKRTRSVSTVRSRAAAAALSRSASPSLAQEKPAAPKTKKASSALSSKKKTPAPTNPSSMRAAAAAATSKTTVGYARGRSVSSRLRGKTTKAASDKAASKSILSPQKYMELYGPPPLGSEMWRRCKAAGCLDGSKPEDEVEEVLPIYHEDEEELNFQLTL